ncbi:hypothetical protein KSP40_PGU000491 [Platanthera guangdongensis]|uniref:Uncharacterized protein n=1 Tax=Platanthera guangdongensis TaxID=2320717 RepID=A0ABR2M7J5_9ASPA
MVRFAPTHLLPLDVVAKKNKGRRGFVSHSIYPPKASDKAYDVLDVKDFYSGTYIVITLILLSLLSSPFLASSIGIRLLRASETWPGALAKSFYLEHLRDLEQIYFKDAGRRNESAFVRWFELQKRTRVPTTGIGWSKRKYDSTEKIEVHLPADRHRFVGDRSQELITRSGRIVRLYAPLNVERWAHIPILLHWQANIHGNSFTGDARCSWTQPSRLHYQSYDARYSWTLLFIEMPFHGRVSLFCNEHRNFCYISSLCVLFPLFHFTLFIVDNPLLRFYSQGRDPSHLD